MDTPRVGAYDFFSAHGAGHGRNGLYRQPSYAAFAGGRLGGTDTFP